MEVWSDGGTLRACGLGGALQASKHGGMESRRRRAVGVATWRHGDVSAGGALRTWGRGGMEVRSSGGSVQAWRRGGMEGWRAGGGTGAVGVATWRQGDVSAGGALRIWGRGSMEVRSSG